MSRKAFGNPTCPRCGWPTRKNGHQPGPQGRRYQNYRCTNPDCRHQFQPERPQTKKEPCIRCPVCGRAMEVYKVRATYVRYRCTGRKKCHHKLDVPTGLTPKDLVTSLGLMEYGPFQFQRMRYSKQTVAIALYFSVYTALPATTTATILRDLFSTSPSADTTLI